MFQADLCQSFRFRSLRRFLCSALAATFAALLISGCGPAPQVTKYEAPKAPEPVKAATGGGADGTSSTATEAGGLKGRMLAAMVENAGRVWFFKLMGPDEGVARLSDDFETFVSSVEFVGGQPKWKLPDGWTEKAGSGMRFATVNAGQPGMDASVISLPAPQDILENVNRWRGQLSSTSLTKEQLADEAKEIKIGDATATLVNLAGTMKQGGGPPFMGGGGPFSGGGAAPFAGGPGATGPALPSGHPAIAAKPPATETTAAANAPNPGFEYAAPEGWEFGRAGGMRKMTLTTSGDEGSGEFTVITLGKGGAAMLPNVNRWRGQLGLNPIEEDGLAEVTSDFKVSGEPATLIELVGPADGEKPQSMSVVMAERGQLMWFYKFMGDAPLVAAEKEKFLKLMESIKFPE